MVILNDNKTVGVITSVQKDTVIIYDTEGYTKTVNKIQVQNKLNPRGRTKNLYGQEIYPKCIVRVSDGLNKGSLAAVKHVYNNFLFLHSESRRENAGIFVEHINNCYFISANMYDNTSQIARFNNPILKKSNEDQQMSQNYMEEKKDIENGSSSRRTKQDPKSKRVNLIGQTKTICKGVWRGYQGIIMGISGKFARVELSAKCKIVSVPIEHLNIDPSDKDGFSSQLLTGKTPIYKGANSPFYISTPAYNPE